MSLSFRKAATASALALAVLAAGATSAQADIQKTLNYSCKYPAIVGTKPLQIDISANIPAFAKKDEQQPAFVVDAVATAKDGSSELLEYFDVASLTGVSEARASLLFPSGFVQGNLKVPLTVAKWQRPASGVPDPVTFTATGKTPSVNLDEFGATGIRLDKISLNLAASDQAGQPIRIQPHEESEELWLDSDGNVNTFDVYCTLVAGQNPILATVCVNATGLPDDSCGSAPDTTAPSAPVLKIDSSTYCPRKAVVSWTASTDEPGGSGLKGYVLTRDGQSINLPAGTTSYTYTDGNILAAKVEAVDNAGNVSPASFVAEPGPPVVSNCPPTAVTGLKAGPAMPTSVSLTWDASTAPDPGSAITYNVYRDGIKLNTAPITGTSYTATGLTTDTSYTFQVEAVRGTATSPKVSITARTIHGDFDLVPPSVPVVKIDSINICPGNSLTVSWTPSIDPPGFSSGLKGYVLTYKGETINVSAGTTTYTFTGVAGFNFSVDVAAVDNAGNRSAASTVTASVPIPNCGPPTRPTALKANPVTQHSVALSWTPSTSADDTVKSYNVYRNGAKVGTVTGLSFTDQGLTADTTYQYAVAAVNSKDLEGPKSDTLTVKTLKEVPPPTCPQGFACYDYSAKGTTSLKTLTTGTLPLNGGIKAQLDISDGSFTADLTLNNTSGRLTAAGFLPLTAKVGFVPVGKTTGQLDDATATKPQSISTNSKVRIKVLEVKLFGAIPLAGGNSCQTKSLSDINLKSTNAFDPLKGGTVGGTYAISDLNGCGPLNGLVSPLTAGGGNTISLTLTKSN